MNKMLKFTGILASLLVVLSLASFAQNLPASNKASKGSAVKQVSPSITINAKLLSGQKAFITLIPCGDDVVTCSNPQKSEYSIDAAKNKQTAATSTLMASTIIDPGVPAEQVIAIANPPVAAPVVAEPAASTRTPQVITRTIVVPIPQPLAIADSAPVVSAVTPVAVDPAAARETARQAAYDAHQAELDAARETARQAAYDAHQAELDAARQAARQAALDARQAELDAARQAALDASNSREEDPGNGITITADERLNTGSRFEDNTGSITVVVAEPAVGTLPALKGLKPSFGKIKTSPITLPTGSGLVVLADHTGTIVAPDPSLIKGGMKCPATSTAGGMKVLPYTSGSPIKIPASVGTVSKTTGGLIPPPAGLTYKATGKAIPIVGAGLKTPSGSTSSGLTAIVTKFPPKSLPAVEKSNGYTIAAGEITANLPSLATRPSSPAEKMAPKKAGQEIAEIKADRIADKIAEIKADKASGLVRFDAASVARSEMLDIAASSNSGMKVVPNNTVRYQDKDSDLKIVAHQNPNIVNKSNETKVVAVLQDNEVNKGAYSSGYINGHIAGTLQNSAGISKTGQPVMTPNNEAMIENSKIVQSGNHPRANHNANGSTNGQITYNSSINGADMRDSVTMKHDNNTTRTYDSRPDANKDTTQMTAVRAPKSVFYDAFGSNKTANTRIVVAESHPVVGTSPAADVKTAPVIAPVEHKTNPIAPNNSGSIKISDKPADKPAVEIGNKKPINSEKNLSCVGKPGLPPRPVPQPKPAN